MEGTSSEPPFPIQEADHTMTWVDKEQSLADPVQQGWWRSAWRESHGTWLLAFAAVVFVIGIALIAAKPEPTEETPLLVDEPEPKSPTIPENVILVRVSTDQPGSDGPIRIAIYDSEESFGNSKAAILRDSQAPVDGFVVWEIALEVLPPRFSVAAYHDINNDGELNRGLFNAPTEPYGFSNNARGLTGPPSFDQTIVAQPLEPPLLELRVF